MLFVGEIEVKERGDEGQKKQLKYSNMTKTTYGVIEAPL